MSANRLGARADLRTAGGTLEIFRLDALGDDVERLPYSMKVLLEYLEGASVDSLGLTGNEEISILGLSGQHHPPREVTVRAGPVELRARVRIDTPREADYFRHGRILQHVLRTLAATSGAG